MERDIMVGRTQLDSFANDIRRLRGRGEPTLYPYFKTLIESIYGGEFYVEILQSIPEANVPDVNIQLDSRLITCIEIKAPNVSIDPLPTQDAERYARYQEALPHIVITNGISWIIHKGASVTARMDFHTDWLLGSRALSELEIREFNLFCDGLLSLEPAAASTNTEAIEMLARAARLMESAVLDVGDNLPLQLQEARELLGSLLLTNPVDNERLDNRTFADVFAQMCTFGYLIARIEAGGDISPSTAHTYLNPTMHPFLSKILYGVMAPDPRLRATLSTVLLTSCEAVNASADVLSGPDGSWNDVPYVYENFFAEYKPEDRDKYGVFYTPMEITRFQIRQIRRLLVDDFGKTGLNDPSVSYLDPACGTGTYLIALAEASYSEAIEFGQASNTIVSDLFTNRVTGFEVSPGPASVCQARLASWFKSKHITFENRIPVFVVNTLTPPAVGLSNQASASIWRDAIGEEQNAGDQVKGEREILVVVGNPPWGRRNREYFNIGEARTANLLEDWSGQSQAPQSVYDLYIAFWRFASSMLLERLDVQGSHGIISFMTNRNWLRGKPFRRMRAWFRDKSVNAEIVDLGGDSRAGLFSNDESVFSIQTGCAISTLCFTASSSSENTIKFTRIWGRREEKLQRIDRDDIPELEIINGRGNSPFGKIDWSALVNAPTVTDLFRNHYPGVKTHRDSLVVDVDYEVLVTRMREWSQLSEPDRTNEFNNTADRQSPSIDITIDPGRIKGHRFRPLDNRFIYFDRRFIDRPGRISRIYEEGNSNLQALVFLDSRTGEGPIAIATDILPGYHSFRGSWGCHVIPLERSSTPLFSNNEILTTLCQSWCNEYDANAIDVGCYILAITNSPQYHNLFAEALESERFRVPLTRDSDVFSRAVALGTTLLHAWTLNCGFSGSWYQEGFSTVLGHATIDEGEVFFENGDTLLNLHPLISEFSVSTYGVFREYLAARENLPITVELTEDIRKVAASIETILNSRAESTQLLREALLSS